MSEAKVMAEKKVCGESMTRDSWHFFRCWKPAKFMVILVNGRGIFRCGIHVKRFRRGKLNKIEAL